MKQLRFRENLFRFRLERVEALQLKQLLANFPFTPPVPARISKTDSRDEAWEREQLLQESLAEHRAELRRQARALTGPGHLMELKTCWRLTLLPEERELLLQILNDIRVGCWQALERPAELRVPNPTKYPRQYALMALLHLAGGFEHHLIAPPGQE